MPELVAEAVSLPGNLQQRELLPILTAFPFNPLPRMDGGMGNLCRDKGNINFLAQRSTGSENSRPGAAEIPQTGGVAGGGAGVRFMRFSRSGAAMRCRVFPIFAGNRIRRMMTAVKYDNSPVRRQDRLLEEEHAAELLRSGEYGFLALGGGRGGYGVPVNYAAEGSRIYIHCAPEGEKLRRIGQDAQAVFCVVGRTAPQPERFTTEYESIMASGVVSVVSDDGERMRALSLIVEKYSPGYEEQGAVYARKSFARTVVPRLDIRSMTGKCKRLGR